MYKDPSDETKGTIYSQILISLNVVTGMIMIMYMDPIHEVRPVDNVLMNHPLWKKEKQYSPDGIS